MGSNGASDENPLSSLCGIRNAVIKVLRARVAELEAEVERVRAFWEAECKRIADERDALNVEIVTQARSMAVERGLLSRCERPDVVAALRLQLEQSKAEVERLTKERDEARVACWTERKNFADEYVEPYRAALARAEKVEGELEVIHAARVRTYEPIYKKNESGHCVRVPPSNEPYGRVFGGFECVREVEVTGIQVLVSEDGSFDGGVVVPLLRITSQRVTSWIALDTDGMRYLALCCDNAAAYSEGRTL